MVEVEQRVRLEEQLDEPHRDGASDGGRLGLEASLLEDLGRVVDDRLDPDGVLQHRKHRANHDRGGGGRAQQVEPRPLLLGRHVAHHLVELRVRLRLGRRAEDAALHGARLVNLAFADQEARRLWQEEHAQGEKDVGCRAEEDHPAPLVRHARQEVV